MGKTRLRVLSICKKPGPAENTEKPQVTIENIKSKKEKNITNEDKSFSCITLPYIFLKLIVEKSVLMGHSVEYAN